MYKILIVTRKTHAGVHSLITEFDNESEANLAYDRIQAHSSDYMTLEVVKLY